MNGGDIMPIRNQSNLGSAVTETKKSQNMSGMLFYGKVIKVYPKHHSADVELYNNHYGKIVSASGNRGKYACRILEPLAGKDSQLGTLFGTSHPVQAGCNVVVGFLSNYSAQPVILGCIYPSDTSNIINQNDDYYKTLSVSRLQDYKVVTNNGELEIASNCGAMLSTSLDELDESFELEDGHLSFDYPYDANKRPLSIGAIVRTAVGKVKLIINSFKGTFAIINKLSNKSAFLRFDEKGNAELGIKGETETKIKIDAETNEISVSQKDGKTSIVIDKDGSIKMITDNNVNVTTKKDTVVQSTGQVRVKGSHITLSSNSHTISF